MTRPGRLTLALLLALTMVLAGDGAALTARMAEYEAAGATDLMLGFADFPSTTMLERFAATALAGRSA